MNTQILMPPREKKHLIEHDIFGEALKSCYINSKQKGNRNELQAAKFLEDWTGLQFNRVPSSGGLRWKNSEGITGDVVCEDKKFIFCVETKHYKKLSMPKLLRKNSIVYTIYKQCKRDSDRAKKIPLLILRENGMPAGEFIVYFDLKTKSLPATIIPVSLGIKNRLVLTGYNSNELKNKITFKKFLYKVKNSLSL